MADVHNCIRFEQTAMTLRYQEELDSGGSRVFLWLLEDGDRRRPIRIRVAKILAWALKPKPGSSRELARAGAQLAIGHLRTSIASDDFFTRAEEHDVQLTGFDGDSWDPAATPWVACS